MKVIDNRKVGKKVKFEDLPIGDAYLDEDDNICIKTSDDYEYNNCMYYRPCGEEWVSECEYKNAEVRPIKITYTIEG